MSNRQSIQLYALILWVLLGLFIFHVSAQLAVAFLGATFLPPMDEWFSGVLPYAYLLVSQFIIIAFLLKICLEFSAGKGWWTQPRRSLSSGLLIFGAVYLAVIIIRHALRMSLYPPERWLGGSIPVFFHWVLATYVLTLGVYHRKYSIRSEPRFSVWVQTTIKFTFFSALVPLIAAWTLFQVGPTLLASTLDFRSPQYAVRISKDVTFTTTDDIRLSQTVFRPLRIQKTPTILIRIPYDNSLKHFLFGNIIGRMWAERGYTVVIQGVRGRYLSDGIHIPFQFEHEDGAATLDWISKQPWFNGKVGMWGGSYFGYTQWAVSNLREYAMAAMMVQLSSSDFYPMFYPGGAYSFESALNWAVASRGEKNIVPEPEALERGYAGWPLTDADQRAAEDIGFYNDWVAHPDFDEFWVKFSHRNRIRSLTAPVHLMAGWFDPFLRAQLDDFRLINEQASAYVAAKSELVIGPWAHAFSPVLPGEYEPRNYRLESLAFSLPWFDEHLMSLQSDIDRPPVRIFVMGLNQWRNENEWPLQRTEYTNFFLQPNGSISKQKPGPGNNSKSFVYDPENPVPSIGGAVIGPRAGSFPQNRLETRDDVLIFESPPLGQALEVTGPVSVTLYVRTDRNSTDFTGKLVDVHPDGRAYNLSEGVRRKIFTPGQTTELKINLWPTSNVFFPGHKIRLEISSSNFPRFDRNTNTGGDISTASRSFKANQVIFLSDSLPSRATLPVIPAVVATD